MSATVSLTFGGLTRSYDLHAPVGSPTGPRPLVVNLHGYTGTSAQQAELTGTNALADAEGFFVAYPQGVGSPTNWNAEACCSAASEGDRDDVGFIDAIIDDIGAKACIDLARVYAMGFSNGGMMTYRLGCEDSARFAAAASVSGSAAIPLDTCVPTHAMPLLHVHGTADTLVPYDGGPGGLPLSGRPTPIFPAVGDEVAAFRTKDVCPSASTVLFNSGNAHCDRWAQCQEASEVVLCTIDQGGHAWPGGTGLFSEQSPLGATAQIWEFFKRHSLSYCSIVSADLEAALIAHRAGILRHCYRMMGSYAEAEELAQDALERAWAARSTYRGAATIRRWLYAIATNACINALARRRRRLELPQLEMAPITDETAIGEPDDTERWLTPAPDSRLFPSPVEALEQREDVSLAFVALLQRAPPRQRAVFLLKDVLDWTADEIAVALGISVPSVNSALHRARLSVKRESPVRSEPPEATLRAFVAAWETRDIAALLDLLRDDVSLSMPPWAAWFRGVEVVEQFLRSERFRTVWSRLSRAVVTRANGLPALAFFRNENGVLVPHAIMVVRFVGVRVAEMTVFIGPRNFRGFDFP